MKITIQIMAQPYTYQDFDTAIKIAEAALERGHEVGIFLFCDSILGVNAQIKPIRHDRKIPEILRAMIAEKGLKVDICGICMDYRGVTKEMIVEGSRPSGLPELAELVAASDRFISLMA
jgi:tRNA 2-thiouridine synthesizing protein D